MEPSPIDDPFVHVALWRATSCWQALDEAGRDAFQERVAVQVFEFGAAGARLQTSVRCDRAGEGFALATVWAFPDEAVCRRFTRALDEVGWSRYFQRIDLVGRPATLAEALAAAAVG